MESILVVDDHPTVQFLLKSILARDGYTVHTADHGAAALELLTKYPDVALVVTDLDMPVMGGLEFLGKLESYARLFKLVVSGHPLEMRALERHGVSAHFKKPLDIKSFRHTVSELLRA